MLVKYLLLSNLGLLFLVFFLGIFLWLKYSSQIAKTDLVLEKIPLLFNTLEVKQAQFQTLMKTQEEQLQTCLTQLTHIPNQVQKLMLEELYKQQKEMNHLTLLQTEKLAALSSQLKENNFKIKQTLLEQYQQSNEQLSKQLNTMTNQLRLQLLELLKQSSDHLSIRFSELVKTTDERLIAIGSKVDKRLAEGFEKTNATFSDVIKRLALIDEAQKRIAALSTDVVSLQDLLNDKRSRGAFGEVQLNSLIRNSIPEQHFSLQHSLSNGRRVDCLLLLPEPTGNVPIDAKFPLENYQHLCNYAKEDANYSRYEKRFIADIRKHIDDIAFRYILPGETAEGAVMFIPAEAIFSKIHSDFPQLIEYAHQKNVWLVSPTTMMAILTTARAVLKDSDTRKQVHIIQKHLQMLSQDFKRFEGRMNKLAKHIDLAYEDVKLVNTSARKITQRFNKIEQVELDTQESIAKDKALLETTNNVNQ